MHPFDKFHTYENAPSKRGVLFEPELLLISWQQVQSLLLPQRQRQEPVPQQDP